jgi:phosphomethylpyrimidine synthase
VYVYDTSGPYTDPDAKIDIRSGLAATPRLPWIRARRYGRTGWPHVRIRQGAAGRSGTGRAAFQPAPQAAPRAAGKNVTQMHYARQGIITPEMEYVAIRENLRRKEYLEQLKTPALWASAGRSDGPPAPGQSFGASIRPRSRRNSCAKKSPAAAPSSRPTSTTRKWSR